MRRLSIFAAVLGLASWASVAIAATSQVHIEWRRDNTAYGGQSLTSSGASAASSAAPNFDDSGQASGIARVTGVQGASVVVVGPATPTATQTNGIYVVAGGVPFDFPVQPGQEIAIIAATDQASPSVQLVDGNGVKADFTAASPVQGPVADSAVAPPNPVPGGGWFKTTPPTYTDGMTTTSLFDTRGQQQMDLCTVNNPANCLALVAANADAYSVGASVLLAPVKGIQYGFNGSTWDRIKTATAAAGTTGTGLAGAGELTFDGTNWQAHKSDTSGTAYVAALPAGTPETCASGNVANATVACTLATSAGKTTYIGGFVMTAAGATAALSVDCTLTGLITGTQTFSFSYAAGVTTASTPLVVQFSTPIPASAANTTIVASCPAGGSGAAHASISAWGGQR